ncbi:MAG: protein translocase subunit SecF [Geminicoccaceae bacterium]|nr:protein translocase subunit SecF [Geminicoccaceae bacterium]
MRLRLLPDKPNFAFMRWRVACFAVSAVLVVLSAVIAVWPGLNYGIDFEGGILIEVKTPGPADLGTMRQRLNELGLGQVALQEFGAPDDVLIRVQRQEGDEGAQQQAVETVKAELAQLVGDDVTFRRTEFVGPKVSEELLQEGLLAVGLALVFVLIYIWFRFEWQYGVGAIVALVHDVVMTIGMFAVTGLEVNLSTVAAVLTIVGYSLNDTVVIFDRVRENLRRYKTLPIIELIDQSINETLARTLMTSLTTLIALLSLFFFGGEVVKGFTFAMIWGIVIGTYSTIYIASPVLIYLDLRSIGQKKAADASQPG